jgi:hypothetical protein
LVFKCKGILEMVDMARMTLYPRSHQVMFYYLSGRTLVLKENYEEVGRGARERRRGEGGETIWCSLVVVVAASVSAGAGG